MTSRILFAAAAVLAAAMAGPAIAQTSPNPSPPAHATTATHKAVHKAATSGSSTKAGTSTKGNSAKAGTKTAKHVPVLVPRHAGPPRHATPTTAAASKHPLVKPALKPAGRLARKEKEAVAAAPAKPAAPKKPPPPPVDPSIGTNTGLHLPRYASLKSDDVNMRVGPAERYPVIWTYKRRELPVKIEREFDIWRLVEDMDGVKGWVHQATLTGRRTFVITGTEDRTLRTDASETADPVAVLKPGVVGRIKSCDAGKLWCQVQVQDYRGWLQRSDIWGVDADEVVTP